MNTVVFVGCITVTLAFVFLSIRGNKSLSTLRARTHIHMFLMWYVMLAMWPVVWATILEDARHDPIALPSLLWPIVIISLDTVGLRHVPYESHTQSKKSLLNMDANAICSLTFALSSIVSAQKDACCKRIFLFSVLFCVAFVLPSLHTGTSATPIAIEASQKGFLAYATGLLLAGVLIASKKNTSLEQ